jgi:hypothetical protein
MSKTKITEITLEIHRTVRVRRSPGEPAVDDKTIVMGDSPSPVAERRPRKKIKKSKSL